MLCHLQEAPRFADAHLGDLKPEGCVRWVERLWKTTEGLKPECVGREGGRRPREDTRAVPRESGDVALSKRVRGNQPSAGGFEVNDQ